MSGKALRRKTATRPVVRCARTLRCRAARRSVDGRCETTSSRPRGARGRRRRDRGTRAHHLGRALRDRAASSSSSGRTSTSTLVAVRRRATGNVPSARLDDAVASMRPGHEVRRADELGRPADRRERSRSPPGWPACTIAPVAHRERCGRRARTPPRARASRAARSRSRARRIAASSSRIEARSSGSMFAPRLVEQHHRRARRERSGERDALLLAAGELVRVATLACPARPTSSSTSATRGRAARRAAPRTPTFSATVRCGKSA